MGSDYQYQPLPHVAEHERAPPYSRILCLDPGSGDEPLAGHLELVDVVAPHRPYEALSYTWGTAPPSDYIWLQGQPLPIRPNLQAGLTWLRHPNQQRALWIDALCIDQSNVDERTRQVQYMRLVYKHAVRVVVWLGIKTPGVEVAFEMARRLARVREIAEQQKRHAQGQPFQPAALDEIWQSTLQDMPPDSMQRLQELLHRPYFERTWCVQEVAASSQCIVKCEELEIPFVDLTGSVFGVAHSLQRMQHNTTMFIWWKIWDSKQARPSMSKPQAEGSLGSMLELMDFMRGFQATDARDKIFAMQGICDEGLQPVLGTTQVMGKESLVLRGLRRGITFLTDTANNVGAGVQDIGRPVALRPNYRRPALEVYIDFTRFMIRRPPRVLNVLDHISHATDPEGGEYPSWVPKWFEAKTCLTMKGYFLAGFCDGHFRYFARVHDNPLVGSPQNPRVLSIDGFKADTIYSVTDIASYHLPDVEAQICLLEKYWSQLFPFPLIPSPQTPYRDGQPLDVAFCKAISAHPFGDALACVSSHSLTGVDYGLPENFEEQVKSTTIDGGKSAKAFLHHLHRVRVQGTGNIDELDDGSARFLMGARAYSDGRRLFVTREGRVGLGPQLMQPGDEVVVLFGGKLPFVVRPRHDHHIFIGQCYVTDDELMQGKVTERILRPKGGAPGPPIFTFNFR